MLPLNCALDFNFYNTLTDKPMSMAMAMSMSNIVYGYVYGYEWTDHGQIIYRWADQLMDLQTNIAACRVACTRLMKALPLGGPSSLNHLSD